MSLEDANSPGSTLAAARTSMGASQHDIAEALNLPVHIVVALEADDDEVLPAFVFSRGYVRAYAKLLEIDPDPLVNQLGERHQGNDTSPAATANVAQTGRVKRGLPIPKQNLVWLAAGGVLILLLLLGIIFTPSEDDDSALENESAEWVC